MKNRIRGLRILSAGLAFVLTLQPILPGIAAIAQTKNMEQALASSNVFSRADTREKAALSKVWATYLETFAGEAAALKQHLVSEEAMIEAMQAQLAKWTQTRGSLKATDDCLKLSRSLDGLGKLLGDTLSKRESVVKDLLGQVEAIDAGVSGLKEGKSVSPQVFVDVYRFDMNARLLDSARGLTDRLWNVLALGQVDLAARMQLDAGAREAFVSLDKPLADLLAGEPAALAKWSKAREALQAALAQPLKGVDVDREAVLLKASLKLADQTAAGLRAKTDANSTAHFEMAKRFKAIIERRSEQLVEVAQTPVEGLPQESFLLVPDPSRLAGHWAQYAARHEQIGRDLVAGLAEADNSFQTTLQASDQSIASAQKVIGSITAATVPASAAETFDALKKGLVEAQKDLASSTETLKQLGAARRALLDRVQAGGKTAFVQPDLRIRTEADAYESLGRTYELAQALAVEVHAQVCAVLTLTEAAQSVGAVVSTDELKSRIKTCDKDLSDWSALAAKKQTTLEQFRNLCIDVTSRYSGQVAQFAGEFKRELDVSPAGQYAKVLQQMLPKLERGSETIAAFSQPMLEAVKGAAPRVQAPALNWIGTSTVGGALTRMIERGAYFQSAGMGQVKALLAKSDAKDFSNILNIADLAMALDYPIRTFVAPDGMAMVIGLDGPGVVIRGIGNVEQYKLNANAPQASVVPDFTLAGVPVGDDWLGGFSNWCSDVRKGAGDAINAAGQAVDTAVRGVQQFGAQVVDNVGSTADSLWRGACEVGDFLWKTGGNFVNQFVKDPWKIVEYIGYGAAIVGTGGLAAPFVGMRIGSDLSRAGIEAAEQKDWITEEQVKQSGVMNFLGAVDVIGDVGIAALTLPKALTSSGRWGKCALQLVTKGTLTRESVGIAKWWRTATFLLSPTHTWWATKTSRETYMLITLLTSGKDVYSKTMTLLEAPSKLLQYLSAGSSPSEESGNGQVLLPLPTPPSSSNGAFTSGGGNAGGGGGGGGGGAGGADNRKPVQGGAGVR